MGWHIIKRWRISIKTEKKITKKKEEEKKIRDFTFWDAWKWVLHEYLSRSSIIFSYSETDSSKKIKKEKTFDII